MYICKTMVSHCFHITSCKDKDLLGKGPSQSLLAAHFLRSDEAINRDSDGTIYILRGAVIRKAHLAERFADAHDGFEMTDLSYGVSFRVEHDDRQTYGNRECPCCKTFSPHVCKESRNFILIDLSILLLPSGNASTSLWQRRSRREEKTGGIEASQRRWRKNLR